VAIAGPPAAAKRTFYRFAASRIAWTKRPQIWGALLEQVETWLFSEGCSSLWLTTDVDTRLRAYSFYKEHGWRDWKIENGLRYMTKCA
jgi:hypothetical protein